MGGYGDVKIWFRARIREYRKHFGLNQSDIATLIRTNQPAYNQLEIGERGIDLSTAATIAAIYGLQLHQITDPKQKIPALRSLPERTRKAIEKRKASGVAPRDYDRDIAGQLDHILHQTDFLHTARTTAEIWSRLPDDIRKSIPKGRITDLLGKAPRNQLVQMIPGKVWGGWGNKYILRSASEGVFPYAKQGPVSNDLAADAD